jgi:hypothetical protein
MTVKIAVDTSYQYPGEEITWAGECPFTGGLCFGTESGGVLVPLPDDSGEAAWLVEDLGDVVNGVAFGDTTCAVSSPSRVSIVDVESGDVVRTLPSGAHEVLSLDGDRFLATTGIAGLFVVSVKERQVFVHEHPTEDELYLYSATRLAVSANEILVACAARQSGVIAARVSKSSDDITMEAHLFPGVDVVAVTGIPSDDFPCGAVGLGIDGSLLISRDILKERPSLVKFAEMPGRAYAIRAVGRHLALLTSQALYVIRDFAELVPQLIEGSCPRARIAVADVYASDVYVAFDRYLLAEIDDGISVMDVNKVFESVAQARGNGWSRSNASGMSRRTTETAKPKGSVKSVSLITLPSFKESYMSAIHA